MPSKVYFTDMRTDMKRSLPEKLDALLARSGFDDMDFKDKYVAIKIHFGEQGNLAYLRHNYARVVVERVKKLGGRPFLTDCNTLYIGRRSNALDHLDCARENGYCYATLGCNVIIADGLKGADERLVPVNGERIKQARIGSAIMDADVVISLAHFKCHEQAGIGGALKNLGMGCGSRAGKMDMHYSGKPRVLTKRCVGCATCTRYCAQSAISVSGGKAAIDPEKCVGCARCYLECPRGAIRPVNSNASDELNIRMAEYAAAVIRGRPHFCINMAVDISPFCDCHETNDPPIVADIGMFASADPVAIDRACADAVNSAVPFPGGMLDGKKTPGGDVFALVSPGTDWEVCLSHSEKLGIGSEDYELVKIK